MNIRKTVAQMAIWSLILLGACGGDDSSKFSDMETDTTSAEEELLSNEMVADMIGQIPPPLEITAMIEASGEKYSSELLNEINNKANYNTNPKKAFNLGIYGADLGYINIYQQKQDAITYLGAVTSLANDLNVGQFFDLESIKRLATNSSNLDSLLYISTLNFGKMNDYLAQNGRGNLSVCMLSGGWIEGMYILTTVAQKNPKAFAEKIGDQKTTLDLVVLLLQQYKKHPEIGAVVTEMEALKALYEKVEIVKVYKGKKVEEVNGMQMVTEEYDTTISISDDLLKQISEKVKLIREKIVK